MLDPRGQPPPHVSRVPYNPESIEMQATDPLIPRVTPERHLQDDDEAGSFVESEIGKGEDVA